MRWRKETKAIRVDMKRKVKRKRERGRPNKIWLDTIENDMKDVGVCIKDVENQENWWCRTKVVDSN